MLDTMMLRGCWALHTPMEPRQRIATRGGIIGRVDPSGRFLLSAEVSLPTLLFGHNGRVLATQSEVDDALELLRDELALVAEIPLKEHFSVWRIDLAWNFRLPAQQIIRAHSYLRHPRIHNAANHFGDGNGISWRGSRSRQLVKLYNKSLKSRVPGDILRAEVSLRAHHVPQFFAGTSWQNLSAQYRVFRLFMSALQSIPSPREARTPIEAIATLPPEGRQQALAALSGVSPRSWRRYAHKIESLAAGLAEPFSWAAQLPEKEPPPAVLVGTTKGARRANTIRSCHSQVLQNQHNPVAFCDNSTRIKKMKDTIAMAPMSKAEAQKCVSEIKSIYQENRRAITKRLWDLREREGWRCLDYSSFDDCVQSEFAEMNFSRQHLHRLTDAEQVRKETGLDLADAHALALKNVAPSARSLVLERAQAQAEGRGSTKPTVEDIEAAKRQHSLQPQPPHIAPVVSHTSDQSDPSIKNHAVPFLDEYPGAMKRLVKMLGKELKGAIEGGTLPHVEKKDVILWSKQSDEDLPKINRLVAGGNRWSVKEAIHFMKEMPDGKHRIERLCWLAAAEDGWEGDINGVHFSLTVNRRRN